MSDRENQERLQQHNRVLVELAKSRIHGVDPERALRELTEAAARTLEVERASVWLYDASRTGIECVDLYERSRDAHSSGVRLAARECPDYFQALEEERTIAAHDAWRDPRTREFTEPYLVPLGISSMLDAPVRIQGRTVGVVCHEHVGPARGWTIEEEAFAAALADLVAITLEAEERGRALRESEERFRQLAENIGAVFFMTEGTTETETGRLLYVSPAYERVWGLARDDLDARPRAWVDAVHADDLERVKEALRDIATAGFDEEFRIVRPDGEVRWVRSRAFPVRNERGEPYRSAGIAEDVTERRQAEDSLRQAKLAAEEANRAKDQFLATLSHELRTPLAPVLAVVSGLEADGRLPGDVRRALSMVRRNVELEARLIDDLLDLTRIARGKLELHKEVADVRAALEHAVEICCTTDAGTGRLRMEVDLAASDHWAWVDVSRLSQVFWNLLKNAVKFTPADGTISVRSRDEPGGGLAVQVADTGIGIEPEVLPRIFEAFEQADRRITRQFGGLGLGLAVSKAIVEMHGGSLTAASAGRGRGATFTVLLPPEVRRQAASEERRLAESGPRPLLPLRILLVEDHADTAEAMAALLAARGHQVTLASDVATALAQAEAAGSGRIDLVISDLGLPDGSGLDLMRELSSRYGLKGIALSGYGMEEDVRRSREAGFERHLTKPVNLQALEAAIGLASTSESLDSPRT